MYSFQSEALTLRVEVYWSAVIYRRLHVAVLGYLDDLGRRVEPGSNWIRSLRRGSHECMGDIVVGGIEEDTLTRF